MSTLEYPHEMGKEILGVSSVIENCLKGEVAETAISVGKEIASRGIQRVLCFGCGTSRFAAISTCYALTDLAGLDADYYDAFEFEKYMSKKPIGPKVAGLAF